MTEFIVVVLVAVLAALVVSANTPTGAWRQMREQIKADWRDLKGGEEQ